MKKLISTAATAMLALSITATTVLAQDAAVVGEVRKIDESAGKITLKHGPIKSLGMDEGMTMVFRVKDPGMLKQVAVGDKVKFEAENADTGITVTKIQKMK
jgi:Cu(I)/Ag(I) efflux system periplasmic protein CusF